MYLQQNWPAQLLEQHPACFTELNSAIDFILPGPVRGKEGNAQDSTA